MALGSGEPHHPAHSPSFHGSHRSCPFGSARPSQVALAKEREEKYTGQIAHMRNRGCAHLSSVSPQTTPAWIMSSRSAGRVYVASSAPVGGIASEYLSQILSILKLCSGSCLTQRKSQSPHNDPRSPRPLAPCHCYRLSFTSGPLDLLFLFPGTLFPETAT